VIITVAEWPFTVAAVIVAVPAPTAVTTPSDTVATPESEENHVTLRSAAFAGCTFAVSVRVSPILIVSEVGETVTDVGCICPATVTLLVAVRPFTVVAVITAVPCVTAVTSPVDDTVATDVLEDDQVTARLAAFDGKTSAIKKR